MLFRSAQARAVTVTHGSYPTHTLHIPYTYQTKRTNFTTQTVHPPKSPPLLQHLTPKHHPTLPYAILHYQGIRCTESDVRTYGEHWTTTAQQQLNNTTTAPSSSYLPSIHNAPSVTAELSESLTHSSQSPPSQLPPPALTSQLHPHPIPSPLPTFPSRTSQYPSSSSSPSGSNLHPPPHRPHPVSVSVARPPSPPTPPKYVP